MGNRIFGEEIFYVNRPGLGGHRAGGQPSQHFFAFLAEPDLHLSAVLFALAFGLAESPQELFELRHIHHVHRVILGHIRPLVAVGVALVHIPDALESVLALAHIAGHQRKGGSLDRDVAVAHTYIGAGAVVGAVVGGALDAHIGAQVMLAGDTRVARGGNVVDGDGVHGVYPFPYLQEDCTTSRGKSQQFFAKKPRNFSYIFCNTFVTFGCAI